MLLLLNNYSEIQCLFFFFLVSISYRNFQEVFMTFGTSNLLFQFSGFKYLNPNKFLLCPQFL